MLDNTFHMQHFDSVQSLSDFVGKPPLISKSIIIDQQIISRFAQVTHDTQWIHTDPERAKAESPYGQTIAHGFLILSLLTYWQSTCIDFPKSSLLLNYGFDRIRYTAAVPCGSQVAAAFALSKLVESRPGEARCTWNVQVQAQGMPQPAIHAEWLMMVRYAVADPAS